MLTPVVYTRKAARGLTAEEDEQMEEEAGLQARLMVTETHGPTSALSAVTAVNEYREVGKVEEKLQVGRGGAGHGLEGGEQAASSSV
jgi:hypothetical protein